MGQDKVKLGEMYMPVRRFQVELFTDDSELVVLEGLEGLLDGVVCAYTRGVDHPRAQEPFVKVITT